MAEYFSWYVNKAYIQQISVFLVLYNIDEVLYKLVNRIYSIYFKFFFQHFAVLDDDFACKKLQKKRVSKLNYENDKILVKEKIIH